jgi:hypothetical protein
MGIQLSETARSLCHSHNPEERCVRLISEMRKRSEQAYDAAIRAGALTEQLVELFSYNRELKAQTRSLVIATVTGKLQEAEHPPGAKAAGSASGPLE